MNIGEGLRTAATRLLDMGQEDLQLLLVKKPDDKLDLLIFDPMPGGSGLLEQMLSRWKELIATAKNLLAGCVQGCETACYSCLKTFRNQFHHELLNRHDALAIMDTLDFEPENYRDVVPVFEEEQPDNGTPSNNPEARLLRILQDHHFPAGECRKHVTTSAGLGTAPDWLYEPMKVAVYLDGMSRGLHGDPKTAQRDQLIRGMLELDGYKVIVVQSRDLDDPQAVRQHLRNIAQAIGRDDLASDTPPPSKSVVEELLEFCHENCRSLIRACHDQGKSLPEVGFELQDEQGRVCAEAELAWPSLKLAVLLPDLMESGKTFQNQKWRVFCTDNLNSQELLDLVTE